MKLYYLKRRGIKIKTEYEAKKRIKEINEILSKRSSIMSGLNDVSTKLSSASEKLSSGRSSFSSGGWVLDGKPLAVGEFSKSLENIENAKTNITNYISKYKSYIQKLTLEKKELMQYLKDCQMGI